MLLGTGGGNVCVVMQVGPFLNYIDKITFINANPSMPFVSPNIRKILRMIKPDAKLKTPLFVYVRT